LEKKEGGLHLEKKGRKGRGLSREFLIGNRREGRREVGGKRFGEIFV